MMQQQQQARRERGSPTIRGRGRGGRGAGMVNGVQNHYQGNNSASQQYYYRPNIPFNFNNFGLYGRYSYYPPNSVKFSGYPQRQRELSLGKEEDLETKLLRIARKRFYVDVKENKRGKFIKIAEVGPNNHKSRILMTLSVSAELRDKLIELIKIYKELPEHDATKHQPLPAPIQDGERAGGSNKTAGDSEQQSQRTKYPEQRIKSETIVRENRRYYLDLKENQRGRFLRITMMSSTQRAMIALPAEGMEDLCGVLADYITKFASEKELVEGTSRNIVNADGTSANDGTVAKPISMESSTLRVNRGVVFYFDVGTDRRGGTYLRVSDVRASYRTAITIPMQSWAKFHDTIQSYVDKLSSFEKSYNNGSQQTKKQRSPGGSVTSSKQEEKLKNDIGAKASNTALTKKAQKGENINEVEE